MEPCFNPKLNLRCIGRGLPILDRTAQSGSRPSQARAGSRPEAPSSCLYARQGKNGLLSTKNNREPDSNGWPAARDCCKLELAKAGLVLAGFAVGCGPERRDSFDPQQVLSAMDDALAIAHGVCPADFARRADVEATRARSALKEGRSPLSSLYALNAVLIECNYVDRRRIVTPLRKN